mmetsp:Transcript_28815/g.92606  ORF Transcript_28815/g.92606 Transcript_28815/m.92606 type:complete len:430 (-) Transcript_28815:28-1317(-)
MGAKSTRADRKAHPCLRRSLIALEDTDVASARPLGARRPTARIGPPPPRGGATRSSCSAHSRGRRGRLIPDNLEAAHIVQAKVLQVFRLSIPRLRSLRVCGLKSRHRILRDLGSGCGRRLGGLGRTQCLVCCLLGGRRRVELSLRGGHSSLALLRGGEGRIDALRQGIDLLPQGIAQLVQNHGVEGTSARGLLHADTGQSAQQGLLESQPRQQRQQGLVVLGIVLGCALNDGLEVRVGALDERSLALLRLHHLRIARALSLLLLLQYNLGRHRALGCRGEHGRLRLHVLRITGQDLLRLGQGLLQLRLAGLDVAEFEILCVDGFLILRLHARDDLANHRHDSCLHLVALADDALGQACQKHPSAGIGQVGGLLEGLGNARDGRIRPALLGDGRGHLRLALGSLLLCGHRVRERAGGHGGGWEDAGRWGC